MGTHSVMDSKPDGLPKLLVMCAAIAGALYPTLGFAQDSCQVVSVGSDTSASNMVLVADFGRAWGEVIRADYSRVRSFTVWRGADPDTLLDPMRLYITEVDTAGRPLVDKVIEDGPDLVIPVGKEPGRPIEVKYEFNPPLQLPGPGRYWFAIKEGWCSAAFQLLAQNTNSYAYGAAWQTTPDVYCEGVGFAPDSYGGGFDLIFNVDFCAADTPSKQTTWGAMKAHYR